MSGKTNSGLLRAPAAAIASRRTRRIGVVHQLQHRLVEVLHPDGAEHLRRVEPHHRLGVGDEGLERLGRHQHAVEPAEADHPRDRGARMRGSGSVKKGFTLRTALSRPMAQKASMAAARTAGSGSSKRRNAEFAKRIVCR